MLSVTIWPYGVGVGPMIVPDDGVPPLWAILAAVALFSVYLSAHQARKKFMIRKKKK